MSILSSSFRRAAVAAAVMLAVLPACRKASTPTEPAQSVTLPSNAALDGYVRSTGLATAAGGGPAVGDFDSRTPPFSSRQFYSFDLAGIPAGATIERVTLRLYQANDAGGYALGIVVVDHVDYGAALGAAAYASGTITTNIGALSSNGALEYKTLDVTTAVLADRTASRTRSQFRLRFSPLDSNNNGADNYTAFTDAEDSCCAVNRPPQLVVEYR